MYMITLLAMMITATIIGKETEIARASFQFSANAMIIPDKRLTNS